MKGSSGLLPEEKSTRSELRAFTDTLEPRIWIQISCCTVHVLAGLEQLPSWAPNLLCKGGLACTSCEGCASFSPPLWPLDSLCAYPGSVWVAGLIFSLTTTTPGWASIGRWSAGVGVLQAGLGRCCLPLLGPRAFTGICARLQALLAAQKQTDGAVSSAYALSFQTQSSVLRTGERLLRAAGGIQGQHPSGCMTLISRK